MSCPSLHLSVEIRLVGGSNSHEGRVDIRVGTTWGTVCDDLWDIDDTYVACRQLGYNRQVPCVSVSSSVGLCLCLSVSSSVGLSLSRRRSVSACLCLSHRLSVCLCLIVRRSLSVSVCLSLSLSHGRSVSACLCLIVGLPVSVC